VARAADAVRRACLESAWRDTTERGSRFNRRSIARERFFEGVPRFFVRPAA
jgi:hypothetical protein